MPEHDTDELPDPESVDVPKVNWHRLKTPRFLPPGFAQSIRGVEATIGDDGQLEGEDVPCELRLPSDADIEPGTEVEVQLRSRNPYAARKTEVEARSEAKERRQELKRERKRLKQEREREQMVAESREFWTEYDIPFEYSVAWKGRREELQRGSTGTGVNSQTVTHLFVQEPFSEGRLERGENEYLCDDEAELRYTPAKGHDPADHRAGTDDVLPKVTCSQCQELMERWRTDEETA